MSDQDFISPTLTITARRAHRRAGLAHPTETVSHPAGTFSQLQLRQLRADPELVVVEPPDTDTTDPATATDGATDLLAAIGQLEPGNPDHWTKDGRPDARALAAVVRREVSAAERDAAWEAHQAAQGER
ncbi:HI1506-related protein [Roseospirillum parvum]|uniref:Mu-like prophage FluMu N-terminal domain-containing protein n=1 Tax=Roseospirillum parvum TaxID=83401 RepID=A0A1G8GC01_9PROT|nr:HI1506-related protein [Roseospirillum parvum]SDH91887.1 hypothetical protein SAMN05421742_1237 [Roseospirillum parvum]